MIERFIRTSKNYLVQEDIVEDPVVLAKPWKSAPRKWSLSVVPDDDLEEFFCTTNEEPQEWQKEGRPSNVQLGTPPAAQVSEAPHAPAGRLPSAGSVAVNQEYGADVNAVALRLSRRLEGCRARFSGVSRPAKRFVRHFGQKHAVGSPAP